MIRASPEEAGAAAVGRPSKPTPTGQFYVTVKLRPPQISPVYGAWALALSGFSNVLDQFGTGDGQIALHGTSNTAEIGQAVSHGCVRLDNQVVTTLAKLLPLGTPVTIHLAEFTGRNTGYRCLAGPRRRFHKGTIARFD